MKTSVFMTAVSLGLATLAVADEKGQLGLDLKPVGGGVGISYQLSQSLSMRPMFIGAGISSQEGSFFKIGTDLRYTFSPAKRTAPYLIGVFKYQYGNVEGDAPHSGVFGVGIGARHALSERWSVFGDASLNHYTSGYYSDAWGRVWISDSNAVQFGVGVTLLLKK